MPPVLALPKKPQPAEHIDGAVSIADAGGVLLPSALAMTPCACLWTVKEIGESPRARRRVVLRTRARKSACPPLLP